MHFHTTPAAFWLITSFFFFLNLIHFIACFLKDPKNFFMQSLPLYTSCLYFRSSNDDMVNIEKSNGICSPTFVLDKFSELSLYLSIVLLNNQNLHKKEMVLYQIFDTD